MQEKRRFVRIDWPIVIQYMTLEEPHTVDQIVGKDISENGVRFNVYERLAKGIGLDMQIQTPFDSLPIFTKGKVVWIKKVGGEQVKTFEVGVEFVEINPEDQKRLRTYIQNEIEERKSGSQ